MKMNWTYNIKERVGKYEYNLMKPDEKPTARGRYCKETNIKMLLRCEGVAWIHVTHTVDRWRAFVNTVSKKCVRYLEQQRDYWF
jgi:hypothetical protein